MKAQEQSTLSESFIFERLADDLRQVQDIDAILNDPIGHSVYLYFILKNRIRTPQVDNFIDWMNVWVDNIINQKKYSGFIDRDITSALFTLYSLKLFGKLTVKIKEEDLISLFQQFLSNDHFFDNYTFTAIICLSLHQYRKKIPSFDQVLGWIKSQLKNTATFNDGKNMVFSAMLLNKVEEETSISRIFNYCFDNLHGSGLTYFNALYQAYILWNFKGLRANREDIQKIRQFTNESLSNAERMMLHDVGTTEVQAFYGPDVQKTKPRSHVSKIHFGVFLDLYEDFNRHTVQVSREELARTDIPYLVSLGSLFATIIFFSAIGIIILDYRIGAISIGSDATVNAILNFSVNFILLVISATLFLLSLSLFYDTGIKRISNLQVIKSNIQSRWRKYVAPEFIIPVAIALLNMFFGF